MYVLFLNNHSKLCFSSLIIIWHHFIRIWFINLNSGFSQT